MSLVSVIIPCKNEEKNIESTVSGIQKAFEANSIYYEIIVINDGSRDQTEEIVLGLHKKNPHIKLIRNLPPNGFGFAIRKGLKEFTGDYVIIAMADASDDPQDMVRYVQKMQSGIDCCFGQRWRKGARVEGYPVVKLIFNRIFNWMIRILFNVKYTDMTNAFKCYSRETIDGIKPILSRHFNITVELPLKAIVRGYRYSVISTNWYNKRKGASSFVLKEMGSRYFFIIFYILCEKWLCGADYKKGQIFRDEHRQKRTTEEHL
jgi:dolichol-phosphate mannosyltransferase